MFDTGAYDQKIWNLIYEGLVFSDPEGELMPGLAASWDIQDVTLTNSTPGRRLTYYLNQNVTWHDGTKFTSNDVKFTYDYVMQQQIPIWLSAVEQVVNVETPDDYTVVINLKSRSFFSFLDASGVPILPAHIWKDVGANWRQFVPSQEKHPTVQGLTKEIGTGPFILVEFKEGEFWRMAWNSMYFRRHPAKTFQVDMTSLPRSLTQGDKSDLKVTIKSYTGELLTDAAVTADLMLNGQSVTSLPFTHVGNGVYQASLDTANLQPGAYSLVLAISRGEGTLKQTGTVSSSIEIKAPFPLVPALVVLVVVVIAAGYVVMRRRAKPKTKT
jgi:ABC-type transport system substrate-binding protein